MIVIILLFLILIIVNINLGSIVLRLDKIIELNEKIIKNIENNNDDEQKDGKEAS